MRKSIFTLAITMLLITTFSCKREDSDSVDQDKIYTRYVVEYNAEKDVTYARAHFQFSNATGTKLELVDPAEVLANGELMPFKQALAYYETEENGVVSNVDFQYTDTEETVYSNSIDLVSSININNAIDTLSRSSNFMLEWNGDPLQQGEVITVTIDGNAEDDLVVFTQTGVNATSINLTQDKLSDLGLEEATMYIRRAKTQDASDVTSAGGVQVSRFDGAPLEIYIDN